MKTNILLIDDNKGITEMFNEYFSCSCKNDINIKYVACDGEEGINLLEKNIDDIDLIILDLIMPNKDGIYVLEEMKKRGIKKKVIVSTSYNNDDVIRQVVNYGVDYVMLKPYNPDELEKRIMAVLSNDIVVVDNDLQKEISNILHELGMPSHIKGYQYIRSGINILYEHPETIGGITKELYPELAKIYSTTVSRVERAIRHAIEVSWNRGNLDTMDNLFGHSVDIDKAKPTNSEFIVTIADHLRLAHKKELV